MFAMKHNNGNILLTMKLNNVDYQIEGVGC